MSLPDDVVVWQVLRGPDGGHDRALVVDVPVAGLLHEVDVDGLELQRDSRLKRNSVSS